MKKNQVEALLKDFSQENLSEIVKKIMDIHGEDIEDLKTEKSGLESQLNEANQTIQELNNSKGDIDKVKSLAEEWENKYKDLEAKKESEEFERLLNDGVVGFKPIDPIGIKAHLNREVLKKQDNSIIGLEEQMKALKENKPNLFLEESKKVFKTGAEHKEQVPNGEKQVLDEKYKANPYYKG